MIPWLTCESARELLEPFLDNELSTADQVAVEAHLRSCGTCAARIDDMGLIGWSLRAGTPTSTPRVEDVRALAVLQSAVLTRVRIERGQTLRARLPELFSDMRLMWPAMGATTAVLLCLLGAANIWRLTTEMRPDSVAGLINVMENPGTERNPVRLVNGMIVPRVLDDGFLPDRITSEEWQVAVAAVVTRTGEVGGAELLAESRVVSPAAAAAEEASYRRAVLAAVRGSRFVPAQSADGRPVAVKAVLLLVQTTIREPRPAEQRAVPSATDRAKARPPVPSGVRSAVETASPTA
jgi:hypothetical protein